jgi:polyhydroxybutyrate depolymerase
MVRILSKSSKAQVSSVVLVAMASAIIAACRSTDGPNGGPKADDRSPGAPSGPGTDATDDTDEDDSDAGAPAKPAPPPMVVTTESLDVAGKTRSYVLAAPSTYASEKMYPLVLVLHGDGGDGPSIRAGFAFDAVSAQAAFVAYPTGNRGWNLYDPADRNEDLAFLVALVEALERRFAIDPARVFGMGFSSGAFMVNQVACRRPSLFRAIAPHSGGAPDEPRDATASRWENDYTRCAGQTLGNGPAVLVIHGTADREVTYDSGEFTANYWAFVDGCQSTRSTAVAPSPCVLHDACPPGKPVVLCPISDLGHTLWPMAATAAWKFFSGL